MEKPGRKSTKRAPSWAERLVQARGELSQDVLGERIGKSQKTISGYEVGDHEPTLPTYRAIAKATGADLMWLITGDERCRDAFAGIVAQADEENRMFSWTFYQAIRLFAEESVNASLSYALSYTRKLLGLPHEGADDAEAKEIIQRTIEADRAEFRKDLDEARKKRL
jgi:transcriptional regulator with XRE-family HTH domain